MDLKVIAHIHNNFKEKFGIPRQSGISVADRSVIIFEKEYRDENALRGINGFSHLWLIWHFSQNSKTNWSPTVRPPRLGGNTRMGVFATRSPYRPNPIGLSSVKLLGVHKTKEHGSVLEICGADLADGTPIFDIKPYLAFTDSHPDALCGFADDVLKNNIEVTFNDAVAKIFNTSQLEEIESILSQNPKPSYHNNPDRIYGMKYGGYEIKFEGFGTRRKVLSIETEEEK
jgi:tRNA-Thr(GGU) m(6)t(6)A37 methyltransferase TsaA